MANETKEPGTFSGTKFEDVMPVPNKPQPPPLLAIRLCNFPTDHTAPLLSHMDWLDRNVQPLVRTLQSPWVDLIGYASQLGPADHNFWLSSERCKKVREWIANYSDKVQFNVQWGKGASESATFATNNDGWWRAVEVYVYGFKPPTVVPVVGSKKFMIRCLGTGSGGLSWFGVGGGLTGTFFQIVNKEASPQKTAAFVQAAGALTLGVPTPWTASSSVGSAGGWRDFYTTERVELRDFEGSATLYQDPGMQFGSHSWGGALRLWIDSERLLTLGARITPHNILELDTGTGISLPGMSFGLPGPFRIVGITRDFTP